MVAARFKLSGGKQSACRFFAVVSQQLTILMADAVSSALKKALALASTLSPRTAPFKPSTLPSRWGTFDSRSFRFSLQTVDQFLYD